MKTLSTAGLMTCDARKSHAARSRLRRWAVLGWFL